jgi:hypothetical protein
MRRLQHREDLRIILPRLLPRAVAWAEEVAAQAAACGTRLSARELVDAQSVGVRHAETIRVCVVESIPLPADKELLAAARTTGLLGPTTGLTLGYSILICHGHMSRRLLTHECRHVMQFERAGSLACFLTRYLDAVVQHGYWDCEFERDARAHELPDDVPSRFHSAARREG